MPRWIRVASENDHPVGSAAELVAEDRIIALFHVDDRWFALDGVCPHQGGPLGKGMLQGCIVTCPWHGWQFDVQTGQHQTTTAAVHTKFAVKVEDGEVYVDVDIE